MHIEIPQINKWDRSLGVSDIIKALTSTFKCKGQVTFCFNQCGFISAEAVAILAGIKILRDNMKLQTDIDINTLKPRIKRFLSKSKFLNLFGYPDNLLTDNSLPVYVQRKFSKEGILNYIDQEIMQRCEMPDMSEELHKEIRRAFFELFGNIFSHSESQIGGLVCGQVYPNDKEIQIVFHDTGIGLAKRVRMSFPSIQSDNEAIGWALKRGTSTLSNNIESRGLGLFLLREFIRVNEGEFSIYANNGMVGEIKGQRNDKFLPISLNGTLIDLRIKVRNDVKYILSTEE